MEAITATAGRKAKVVTKSQRILDITVLMGGPSTEREVSLISGQAVAASLARNGHQVTTADISPEDLSALDRRGIDVVFIALHGDFGESGQVQRLCQQRGLTYVGSGPEASELAMDKVVSKDRFRCAGLATPGWAVLEKGLGLEERGRLLRAFGLPCVLKPIDGGSSVDVTIARDAAAARGALEHLLATYGRGLVEQYVAGREFTVGILDGAALPVVEIKTTREFYDYFAKYEDDSTQYIVNPPLPAEAAARMSLAAQAGSACLGCRDFCRVDFMMGQDNVPYVLEVNTIPGFTSHSLLPKAAAAVGISFDQLTERIARMALRRAGR
jgi:D-alanine-D-alanine ligase